jgi:hypothetical protein
MGSVVDSDQAFVVELSQFSGPLDLLLTLIRDEKVDIWDISCRASPTSSSAASTR